MTWLHTIWKLYYFDLPLPWWHTCMHACMILPHGFYCTEFTSISWAFSFFSNSLYVGAPAELSLFSRESVEISPRCKSITRLHSYIICFPDSDGLVAVAKGEYKWAPHRGRWLDSKPNSKPDQCPLQAYWYKSLHRWPLVWSLWMWNKAGWGRENELWNKIVIVQPAHRTSVISN